MRVSGSNHTYFVLNFRRQNWAHGLRWRREYLIYCRRGAGRARGGVGGASVGNILHIAGSGGRLTHDGDGGTGVDDYRGQELSTVYQPVV
jgi:hypothetical protein